ncbi:6-pyruvoyltetrahydropterin/6-carboxytetrahydropterin synthase [Thermosporothrix hazakensis]|jgi:6-pyruvoyltetrahydropterin/6-carboxytetrahydropterin synthase|uniref:6-carboxy-5,6,7,8-tetrahydropterin synthase n=2 Tax=Thermosporothrix TaxID=768650 RepID=A0A326UGN9_THEHA|nr:6-carboxytetrahydropterin synthase [Thermosporothrix hazakensis]PZW26656.1 6-pyruvoyltetrahydropterin/6-carboxytetrahydropterin synthase [Thermosporothrix hazakensis]BBH89458.1 6-carboxy-5,6,7,8-tetrahydropterin synthase [Thermosporothrix sp. COM3]GCE47642.1 6-carboxy-5,6,7,8-tetrahydropterin synthase [Thermosporothrix hazakensis]
MVFLTRRVTFSAAHRLWSNDLSDEENYAIYDKCANPNGHGHNYTLEVTVQGQPDPKTGMIINLTDLKRIVNEQVVDWVDHKHLNHDVPWLEGVIPTTEMLVIKFWERLESAFPAHMLYEVTLHETENNVATYRGPACE